MELDESVTVKVWDSSAQIHWWVLSMSPAGTEGMSETGLALLLTPEAMMGVATVSV